MENDDENKRYTLDGRCSINAILLEEIVEARLNEILDNVTNQIILSGYDGKLLAGAVITGGGINLINMEEAFVTCVLNTPCKLISAPDKRAIKKPTIVISSSF